VTILFQADDRLPIEKVAEKKVIIPKQANEKQIRAEQATTDRD
jgi:hypothetical protein